MFTKTTHGIKVTAQPHYLPSQSSAEEGQFVWAYTITIENHSIQRVQLMRRYWHITDASGLVHEVRGDGVIGEQPILAPGAQYRYSSGTHLGTASGIMRGSYYFDVADGTEIEVEIPAFSLDSPEQIARPN